MVSVPCFHLIFKVQFHKVCNFQSINIPLSQMLIKSNIDSLEKYLETTQAENIADS